MYIGVFVYKIKPDTIINIQIKYPSIVLFEDKSLGDASYLFIPNELYIKDKRIIKKVISDSYFDIVPSSHNGDHLEPVLISKAEVDRMIQGVYKGKEAILIGSQGYLEGFGSIPFLVIELKGDEVTVVPTTINLFKPITTETSNFQVDKELPLHTDYTYNSEIAIDCDIFPAIDEAYTYEMYKDSLTKILFNVHSLVDNININLLNPCPLLAFAGASLGIATVKESKLIISDTPDANIKISVKGGYKVAEVRKLKKGEQVTARISRYSLVQLYNYFLLSGALNVYDVYQLFNRRYFNHNTLLDINLDYNPLTEED